MSSSTNSTSAMAALRHWAVFGRPGRKPERRAESTDWKTKEFVKPKEASWNVPVTPEQLANLMMGVLPMAMEDKWFIYSNEETAPEGIEFMKVHFFRSWTGNKIFEIQIELKAIEAQRGKDASVEGVISKIIWETDDSNVLLLHEKEAKGEVQELCRWTLGVQLAVEEEHHHLHVGHRDHKEDNTTAKPGKEHRGVKETVKSMLGI